MFAEAALPAVVPVRVGPHPKVGDPRAAARPTARQRADNSVRETAPNISLRIVAFHQQAVVEACRVADLSNVGETVHEPVAVPSIAVIAV